MTNLEKYLYQLRRIVAHRSAKAEKEVRKIYKELLKELNGFLGNIYATYSEDDALNYGMLAKAGMDARFLEEVEQRINGIMPKVAKEIRETVENTYEACYEGMHNAVVKAAGDNEELKQAFSEVKAVAPEVIRAAVNNPVSGLTLKDTLEKHRIEIIYGIKKNIGVGLSNGDRYSTMAKRISESLDGDYKKSIRIVRTEAHRVRESGLHDAATELNNVLKSGNSGMVFAKTWRTMKDERVRPQRVYKTKTGWKHGKKGKYDHVKMEGVTIAQDDVFTLPSGAKCKAPSQTGVAGEDINCRCYLSYDLVKASELTKVQNGKETIEEAVKNLEKLEEEFKPAKSIEDAKKYAEKHLGVTSASAYYGDEINLEIANNFNNALLEIDRKFGKINLLYIMTLPDNINAYAAYSPVTQSIGINKACKSKKAVSLMAKEAQEQYEKAFWSTNSPYHSIYHELGHAVKDQIYDNDELITDRINTLYEKTIKTILGNERWSSKDIKKEKVKAAVKSANFSYYGLKNSSEFVAESIAQYFLTDNPSEIAKQCVDTLLGWWE